MDEQGKRIKEYVEAHGQEIIGDLVELTKAQSPTTCKELADACGQKIRELVKERVGIDGTIYPQEKRGDHMSFTLGEQKEQILMLAHFDTVWDKDALPLKQEGDVLYGPGAYDMKAGLVSAIWAMKICKELELPLHKRLCLLCNSDEEVGSGTSQALIEEKAKESAAALCLEPSQGQTGNLKTARKGTGKYVVTVHAMQYKDMERIIIYNPPRSVENISRRASIRQRLDADGPELYKRKRRWLDVYKRQD